MCRSASHSFDSQPARKPALVDWSFPASDHSLNPHGVLSKSFSADWISGLRTIVCIYPSAVFHLSLCSMACFKDTLMLGSYRVPSDRGG